MIRSTSLGTRVSAVLAALLLTGASLAHATAYTWSNAAGGNWSNAANWSPAGVPAAGDQVALPALGAPYTVSVDASPSLAALSVASGATLQLGAADSLRFTGHFLYNDGSIHTGAALASALFFADSVHVIGSGEIVLNGAGRLNNPIPRPVSKANHMFLVNEAGHTIRGSGGIWIPIVNHGVVAAEGAQLGMFEHLYNYADVRTSGATFYMNGAYQSFGGRIVGANGTFTTIVDLNSNVGFAIDNLQGGSFVADGGELYVQAGTIANGTVVQGPNGGAVHFNGLGNPSDVVVSSGAELIMDGQYDWTIDNSTLENHGIVRVRGLLNVDAEASAVCDLTGDGTVVLEGGSINGGALGGALHIGSGITVTGCGTINSSIINDGTWNEDCSSGSLAIKSGTFTNHGRLQVLHGSFYATGATTQLLNYGTVTLGGMSYVDQGATVRNIGSGKLNSTGTVILGWNGAGATIVGGTLGGSGRFLNGGHVTLNGVTIGSGATFTTNGGTTTRVSGASVTNLGTNAVESGGAFTVDAGIDYLQGAGVTQLNGGTLTVPRGFTVNGALRGTGTVAGNVVNAGEVTPDVNVSGIVVQGDFHQLGTGRLNLGLAGYTTDQFAHLTISGAAQLDGAVGVSRGAGFAPASGRTFGVVGAGSVGGQFALVDSDPGLSVQPLYGAAGVTLEATSPAGVGGSALPAVLRFAGSTRGFVLDLPQAASVDVRAYDVTGRLVAVLADGPRTAGSYVLDVTAKALPSGVYFARARVGNELRKATTVIVR